LGTATGLWRGGGFPAGARDFLFSKIPNWFEGYSACYSKDKGGLSSVIKRSARESNHIRLMSKFKKFRELYLLSHVLSDGAKGQLYLQILQKENNTKRKKILTCVKNYGRKISTEHAGIKSQKIKPLPSCRI
jgi:hypothetical protein